MIYLQLFISFFKIGLLGFGGGMAIVSLIQTEVERYGWMSATEYLDILAISQMTPGPIGINCATYVGYTASDSILGALIATSAIILPSLIIMLIISYLYAKIKNRWSSSPVYQWTMVVIRAAVILLIAYACYRLIQPEAFIDGWSWFLFGLVFAMTLLPQWAPKSRWVNFISHPITLIILSGCLGFALYGCDSSSEERRIEQQVESVLSTLTTREKVAQLVMVSTTSYGDSAHKAAISDLVVNEHIGGLIIMQDSLTRSRSYINDYQRQTPIPLLIAVDGEWGPAMRFADFPFFPRQMQLGALPSDSLVYQMGLAVGRQCRQAGIHINFAPSVDINNNPGNVAIDMRSFGESRERVADLGSAYMRGMQDAGIIACAKHFPGHGDTDVDSHKALPCLPFTRDRLDSLELYPFRRLIRDGVEMVMLGHLYVPAYDTTVSSLSYPIITSLLKQDLHFGGMVVTDALVMKGVANGREPADIMEMAYAAGVDMLLMPACPKEGIERISQRVDSGIYSMDDLDNRVRKVLRMKARIGLLDLTQERSLCQAAIVDTTNLTSRVRSEADLALIQQIANQSLTLILNDSSAAPLCLTDSSNRTLLISYNATYQPLRRFYGEVEGLAGYGAGSGVLRDGTVLSKTLQSAIEIDTLTLAADLPADQLKDRLCRTKAYNQVIIAFHDPSDRPHRNLIPDSLHSEVFASFLESCSAHALASNPAHASASNPAHASAVGLTASVSCPHIVAVFFGNPYALNDYPWLASFPALLIAYADSQPNERAAADILLGRIPALGKLPVSAGPYRAL